MVMISMNAEAGIAHPRGTTVETEVDRVNEPTTDQDRQLAKDLLSKQVAKVLQAP